MELNNIDYARTYFKYTVPAPINGELSNKTLKRLKTELPANASSADTNLGGGDHGYLGLILTNVEYAHILPTTDPFVGSNYPGALSIAATATVVQVVSPK